MRTLNRTYGLPEGKIVSNDQMYPTVPSTHIPGCTKSAKFFQGYPLDKQAHLIACCYIMVKGYQQQILRSYSSVVNDGDTHFGDGGFRGLNSYRTL